jgi:pimeloyl-ACP methyl ester carboxylesterase
MAPAITEWAAGEKSGLVSIGSHSLFLHATGLERKPGDVAVIIIQGLACGVQEWAAVIRLLRPFVRLYSYERAGFGRSDSSPEKPTGTAIAAELDLLLRNAGIAPPYVLVAHSWGGVLSREFIERRLQSGGADDVVGIVFVDANQERTLQVADWRIFFASPVLKGLNTIEALERHHGLTDAEWRDYLDEQRSAKHIKQAEVEYVEYPKSFPVLASKNQLYRMPPLLGSRPVCVVMAHSGRDFEKMFQTGVEKGNGTDEERAAFREDIRTWNGRDYELQLEQLSLSSNGRLRIAEGGHMIHITQPEVVVDAVKWVLDDCMAQTREVERAPYTSAML